ncbi:MAG: hypothetical protein AAF265_10725 [Pseudomonadota bacterium]
MFFLIWAGLCLPGTTYSQSNSQPVLDTYLSVFKTNTADDLPLADDVTFLGALLPEPIVGRDQVIVFLNRVAPSVQLTQVKQAFESPSGACAELVFALQDGDLIMEEAHCIRIRDGEIVSIRLYFDPRPLLEASGT